MTRWAGLLLLGLGFAAPAFAADTPPSAVCAGEGAGRRCTAAAVQTFANNRGGLSEVSLSVVRDAQCTTLHIVFDAPIALDGPVSLTVEGAQPQHFYTPAELTGLARALDDGTRPNGVPAEFAGFLTQVSSGTVKDADAGQEMIRRFAAIKEARRIGLACGPMERLLPAIRAGHAMRLEFRTETRMETQVYHWPRLGSRVVDLRLDGLLAALDRAMPGS